MDRDMEPMNGRRRDLTRRHEAAAAEIAARSQQSLIPSEDARPAAAPAAVAFARGANGGGGEGDVIAYYFWVVIIFVFVLSLLNFAVLVAIAGAHNINLYSIDDVELVPESHAVKFLRDVHFAEMNVRGGEIAGYKGKWESISKVRKMNPKINIHCPLFQARICPYRIKGA